MLKVCLVDVVGRAGIQQDMSPGFDGDVFRHLSGKAFRSFHSDDTWAANRTGLCDELSRGCSSFVVFATVAVSRPTILQSATSRGTYLDRQQVNQSSEVLPNASPRDGLHGD